MQKITEEPAVGLSGNGLGLDELVREGARQIIRQAIEADVSQLLEQPGFVNGTLCLLVG